jgi:hypothetical protein
MSDRDDRIARFLLVQEVAEFLYREADLLDERRYEEWLGLLAEDIRYWMPMRRNVKFGEAEREFTRETTDINWFDEGKDTLTRRVKQIQTGIHWAEEPGRNRDRHPGREARGSAAPGRRGQLANRAAQDRPRPERAAEQKPDVLFLKIVSGQR